MSPTAHALVSLSRWPILFHIPCSLGDVTVVRRKKWQQSCPGKSLSALDIHARAGGWVSATYTPILLGNGVLYLMHSPLELGSPGRNSLQLHLQAVDEDLPLDAFGMFDRANLGLIDSNLVTVDKRMAQVVTDIPYRADESQPDQDSRVAPIPRPGYHGRYPRWIGHKFEPDGSVRSFPGHGIMCHLPSHDAMYHALQQFRDDLQQQDFASSLVLLPPSVWHMTVYEGVSDQIRKRNG